MLLPNHYLFIYFFIFNIPSVCILNRNPYDFSDSDSDFDEEEDDKKTKKKKKKKVSRRDGFGCCFRFFPVFFLNIDLRKIRNVKITTVRFFIYWGTSQDLSCFLFRPRQIAKPKILSHLIVCWICSFYLCVVFVIKVTQHSVPFLFHSGPQVYQGRY